MPRVSFAVEGPTRRVATRHTRYARTSREAEPGAAHVFSRRPGRAPTTPNGQRLSAKRGNSLAFSRLLKTRCHDGVRGVVAPKMEAMVEEKPLLTRAREEIIAAAPLAAATMSAALHGSVEKEQIDAAKDILDRAGIRKDAPAAETRREASELVIAAFRAFADIMGVSIPEQRAARVEDQAVPIEAVVKNAAVRSSDAVREPRSPKKPRRLEKKAPDPNKTFIAELQEDE